MPPYAPKPPLGPIKLYECRMCGVLLAAHEVCHLHVWYLCSPAEDRYRLDRFALCRSCWDNEWARDREPTTVQLRTWIDWSPAAIDSARGAHVRSQPVER